MILVYPSEDQIDHKFIDKEIEYFRDKPSTAENLAMWFFIEMKTKLEKIRKENEKWDLEEVIVFETDKNIASVKNE